MTRLGAGPTISRALGALLPEPEAGRERYPAAFRAMAELLLRRATLVVAGAPHRLTEVEFYYHGGGHLDDFSHCDPMQRDIGQWYFHRTGGAYRGGTYKGLDITLGRGDAHGGVLLRGIEALSGPPTLVDGPCLVVDRLLALTGRASVLELASSFDLRVDPPVGGGRSPLWITLDEGEGRPAPIHASPRVGLTLKRGDSEARRRFLAMDYRFLSEPARIRKGRLHLVLSLHRAGEPEAEISRITGVKVAAVRHYVALYEEGRRAPRAAAPREMVPADLCRLLGACHALVG